MRKKILHIISSTTWRGGEQQVSLMVNQSSDQFDNFLFCPEQAEIIQYNASIKSQIFIYKKKMGFDIFAGVQLRKICSDHKIDLIHLHDSHGINTFIIADFLGLSIPAVVHRHVNFPVQNKWKYNHSGIKKIICVSETVKKTMSKTVAEHKLIVIPPGIQLSTFDNQTLRKNNSIKQELNLPENINLVGIVSAFEQEKNIEEFIAVATTFTKRHQDCHFILIGDGSLFAAYRSQFSSSHLHFLGFQKDIPKLLASLDIFLFTSKNEGLPIVLLEAMICKIPVISSPFPSVHHLIVDKSNGFIYSNPEDAIQKIELLLTDAELKNTLVEKAYQLAKQFDISLINKEIEKVYSTILNT